MDENSLYSVLILDKSVYTMYVISLHQSLV